FDAASRKEVVQPLQHDQGRVAVAEFSGDDSHVLTAGDDYVARVWKLPEALPSDPDDNFQPRAAELELHLIGHTGKIAAAAFGHDDKWIASAAQDSSVKLWDASTGQEIAWFEHADVVDSLAFLPGSEPRLISGS